MDKMKTLSDGIKTYEIYDANALHKNEEGKVSEDLNLGTHKILEVGDPVEDGDGVNKKYVDGIDVSEKDITFEIAAKRANVQSGDSLAVAFGKLALYCADLKPHAFADPVNNLLGTNPELPLAAPMGTELKRLLDELNGKMNNIYKTKKTDGSSFEQTFTRISFDSDGGVNVPSFWIINDSNRESWNSIPPTMQKTGTVIGYREVLRRNSDDIMIKITEIYPVPGKQYFRVNHGGSWSDWKTITPQ